MQSLISEIVSIIASSNPQSSPEDIANMLIYSVETEILPEAIRIMKLPPPPSKMRMLLEMKREERHKRKYRTSILEDKTKLARNFEYIKYKLGNGEARTSLRPTIMQGDLDEPAQHAAALFSASYLRKNVEKKDGLPLPKESGFSRFGLRLEREKSYPYAKGVSGKEVETGFSIDNEAQRRLLSDPLFMNIVSSIEVFLRDFARHYPKAHFSISIKNDPQIPMQEKIIVRLAMPDLSFDQKMRVWDHVDIELRKNLQRFARANGASRLDEAESINRKLFTHVDL